MEKIAEFLSSDLGVTLAVRPCLPSLPRQTSATSSQNGRRRTTLPSFWKKKISRPAFELQE